MVTVQMLLDLTLLAIVVRVSSQPRSPAVATEVRPVLGDKRLD